MGLAAVINSAQAGDPVRGESLAQTCMGCHGAEGYQNAGPVYKVPKIGGQHPDYLISALKAYKSKERSHPTMQAQAASLSETDMDDIAAFYASMSGNSRPGLVNEAEAIAGKEKSAACAACHGANGDGEQTIYPKLAGQYKSYLAQALKDYRSGSRDNAIMKGFAAGLTIEDIEALSAWFASQQGGLSAPEVINFK
jgi:cytochrome c553